MVEEDDGCYRLIFYPTGWGSFKSAIEFYLPLCLLLLVLREKILMIRSWSAGKREERDEGCVRAPEQDLSP